MTSKEIIKRDGRTVKFRQEKITNALFKAFMATGEGGKEDARKVSDTVVEQLKESRKTPQVEEIQNLVESTLMKLGYYRTAKAYILYREQHQKIREITGLIHDVNVVEDYLKREDWRVKENSNMTYSLQGLNCYLSSIVVSHYWLHQIYPPRIREAHTSGDFHIHDLGILGAYCVGWDLLDLLRRGIKGVSGKIESKPAKHFKSALGQIVNFLYTLQGEAAGAQAFSNVDTYLSPFIRYDGLDYKEVKQAMQEFIFNLNVPTRVGFQTPFVNFTLDLEVPDFMRNEPVIVGGEIQDQVYGGFQEEMNMFDRAFGEIMMEGDGKGRPFTFPIPTLNITKDFDWDNRNYEPLWAMTAKYGIPYFSNFVNSDMSPDDVRSMCCRLRLDKRELKKRGGGLFGANPLTGSIGVVTINMPRLGYLSKNEDEFFERLDELMILAKNSLEIKRNVIENFTENGLYPYSTIYLGTTKEGFGFYWKNHFSTIGVIGMNEALLNLMGKDIGTEEGRGFTLKVLDYMRKRLSDFQFETGDIYNLEATPAEGSSYRLARLDQRKYPGIIVANSNEVRDTGVEPYYTNSTQLPVDYTDDMFEALRLQDKLQVKYTGGTVFHGFMGEKMPSNESVKRLVRKITQNFSLPYFTITPTFSVCPEHGYIPGEHQKCPTCGKTCEVYSRSVGYLRPVSQWNEGKEAEFRKRQTFDKQNREEFS
ncbi:MAG: ribonucleoside triphosphate reductase [Candidatus Altiarchaeota archaeon]|nr:ribonucleoside triphosphate reductase [Candidatus Altiarchaeota archaeon]